MVYYFNIPQYLLYPATTKNHFIKIIKILMTQKEFQNTIADEFFKRLEKLIIFIYSSSFISNKLLCRILILFQIISQYYYSSDMYSDILLYNNEIISLYLYEIFDKAHTQNYEILYIIFNKT